MGKFLNQTYRLLFVIALSRPAMAIDSQATPSTGSAAPLENLAIIAVGILVVIVGGLFWRRQQIARMDQKLH